MGQSAKASTLHNQEHTTLRHKAQPLRLAAHQYLSAPNSRGYYNKTSVVAKDSLWYRQDWKKKYWLFATG